MATVADPPYPSAAQDGSAPVRVRRSGYLPSLDGWRALAIFAVIMTHDGIWSFAGHSNRSIHDYGGWGVYLFFAISGLLVCTRILEDESLLGHFELRRFYIRRLFRIQPAAVVYLLTLLVLDAAGITQERLSALLGALFCYQNYLFNAADFSGRYLTGHFWTLAVEEHFYLLLSLLLFTVRRHRAWLFAGLVALLLLLQHLAVRYRIDSAINTERHTEWNLQYLLFPALLAILLRQAAILNFAVRWLRPWVVFSGTLLIECLTFPGPRVAPPNRHLLADMLLHRPEVLFPAFGFWVVATMLHPRSWTTRTLELPPLRLLGRLSYSLYLWHVLFFFSSIPVVGVHSGWLLALCGRPMRYISSVAVALLSYYFVEKPMIRLGHSLAPPATPGHRDLTATATQNI